MKRLTFSPKLIIVIDLILVAFSLREFASVQLCSLSFVDALSNSHIVTPPNFTLTRGVLKCNPACFLRNSEINLETVLRKIPGRICMNNE